MNTRKVGLIKGSGIFLESNMSNGLYIANNEGGTGKSYTFKLFKNASKYNKDFACMTYEVDRVIRFGDFNNAKYIFVDRLNLYLTDKLRDELFFLSKKAVVVVDYKISYDSDMLYGSCVIFLRKDRSVRMVGVSI